MIGSSEPSGNNGKGALDPQHGRREAIIFVIFNAENFRKVDAGAEIKVGVPPPTLMFVHAF